jgi:cytochrome c oxidase subunit 2
VAGCTGPLSTLDPSGPSAASIATLWWVMLAGAIVLSRW